MGPRIIAVASAIGVLFGLDEFADAVVAALPDDFALTDDSLAARRALFPFLPFRRSLRRSR